MKAGGVLPVNGLFSGDNGRIFCADLRCAGTTAFFTGRTLAGYPVERVTVRDVAEWPTAELGPIKCESCGREVAA